MSTPSVDAASSPLMVSSTDALSFSSSIHASSSVSCTLASHLDTRASSNLATSSLTRSGSASHELEPGVRKLDLSSVTFACACATSTVLDEPIGWKFASPRKISTRYDTPEGYVTMPAL
eukprot:428280-Rhodomonas_salina.2